VASGILSAVSTLNGSYQTCIASANTATLKTVGKFTSCVLAFAQALSGPQILAQLRILNPNSQSAVLRILAGVVAGINAYLTFTGQQPATAPTASSAELRGLFQEVAANAACNASCRLAIAQAGL
jgi:hypothetical protein